MNATNESSPIVELHRRIAAPVARQNERLGKLRDELREEGERLAAAREERDNLAARVRAAQEVGERLARLRAEAEDTARLAGEAHARFVASGGDPAEKEAADKAASEAAATLRAAEGEAGDDLAILEHGPRLVQEAEGRLATLERKVKAATVDYAAARAEWANLQLNICFAMHCYPFLVDLAATHRATAAVLGTHIEGFREARRLEFDGWTSGPLDPVAVQEVAQGLAAALRRVGGLPENYRMPTGLHHGFGAVTLGGRAE